MTIPVGARIRRNNNRNSTSCEGTVVGVLGGRLRVRWEAGRARHTTIMSVDVRETPGGRYTLIREAA